MHLAKMLSYVRGDNTELCAGCDFCPAASRVGGASESLVTIDEQLVTVE